MYKPIIGIMLFSFIFVGGAYFVLTSGSNPGVPIVAYSSQDKEKPAVEVKESYYDMGTIKVKDTSSKEFAIKNVGTKPLQLSNITSSCGCTTGQIIYKDTYSAEFSMHAQSDYVVAIAPQTEAKIKVVYKPFVMPVFGVVERQVFLNTNDPALPKLEFKIKAFVQ